MFNKKRGPIILNTIAKTIKGPWGWLEWLMVCGLCLVLIIRPLLCLADYIKWDSNFRRYDRDEIDNEVIASDSTVSEITVTATPDYK